MATVYWDRNATGTGSGGNWSNAKSDPALFNSTTFGGSSTADEHIFANGTPWPITATKTEPSSANMLTIRGADNGNGSTEPPWITCFVPAGTVGGWAEIDPAYAIHPNAGTGATATRVLKPGSKLWHTYNSFNGTFVGSYRNGAGETFWGRRCRMVADANGADENAPAQDYAHGVPNFGGQCVYLTAGNPDTNATLLKRPSGVSTEPWKFMRPLGGLDVYDMGFKDSDFALNVENSTAGSLSPNVRIFRNKFRGCRKGVSLIGTRDVYGRTGAGFVGALIYANKFLHMGNMAIHCWGSPVMNASRIWNNISRYSMEAEGAGTIYMDSSYTTDGSWVLIDHNWLDENEYDGKYWLDGSALYAEMATEKCDFWANYITNAEVAAHLNIGAGSHRLRNNVALAGTQGRKNATFVRMVNARAGILTVPLTAGVAEVHGNIADRFSLFAGAVAFDYTGTGNGRFLVHHNIARGRKSLDANDFTYPIQGNGGTLATGTSRMVLDRNNFTDFNGTTITAREYDGSLTTWTDVPSGSSPVVNTSRASNASIISSLPAADNTREDINYALMIPQGITTGVVAAPKPALVAPA